jgi:transposase-like protein
MPSGKGSIRKHYDERFKAKVALDAMRNDQTLAEIASRHRVHANQVSNWRKVLVNEAPRLFSRGDVASPGSDERLVESLYEQIGRLQVELDWLKKTGLERR